MATRKELNDYYFNLYHKNFPSSTLAKWRVEGKIRSTFKDNSTKRFDYNFEDFKKIVESEDYQKKLKATKENPKDYIGKKSGDLLIISIVPDEEKKENYKGTLMYCKCLRCNRPDLIQVRFTCLNNNGNYKQITCGCNRKERAFLAVARPGISEEFINKFKNFEYFLYLHKLLMSSTTNGYYANCDIKEYENAILWLDKNQQFHAVYNFWEKTKKENTFYDWAKPSLDHIIPLSKGGTQKISNLQILTVFENLAKRDMTMEEWKNFKKETNTTSNYFIENIYAEGGQDNESVF